MAIVALELFKKHVKADDFSEDDVYLQHLLDAAEAHILKAVNRTADELTAIGGGTVPVDIKHAIMLIGAHWYNQRESVGTAQMIEAPDTLQALIKPYRKLVEDESRTA